MFFNRTGFALASLLCFSITSIASAQTANVAHLGKKLALRDAIEATLARNPQLNSFTSRREAVEGERQTAGLKPVLRVSTELENVAGTGDFNGTRSAEFTLALSSVIELGGKRDARIGVTTERQHQLAIQQEMVELDLLADVTRRFIDAVSAQEQFALRQSTLKLADDATNAIKRRVEMGSTPDAELMRAMANQSRGKIELRKAEANFQSAKSKLAALWGELEPSFASLDADLLNTGDVRELRDLLAGLEQNPDIQFFASEARLRDAELRLALSQRRADLEWSAGVRRLQAEKDSAFVMGVSIPLSSNNRAAGEIATAQAGQRVTENEREVALLKLRAQLVSLYHERDAAVFEVASLHNEVIPQLKKALAGIRVAFDKGRYGYLELTSAQHELLEAELMLIDAAANAHQIRTELERLSGTSTLRSSRINSGVQP